jgi:hypothetical protein
LADIKKNPSIDH